MSVRLVARPKWPPPPAPTPNGRPPRLSYDQWRYQTYGAPERDWFPVINAGLLISSMTFVFLLGAAVARL